MTRTRTISRSPVGPSPEPAARPAPEVLAELRRIAALPGPVSRRSAALFGVFRKAMGEAYFGDLLRGIHYLCREAEGAGPRLLAAFLDVATLEARLMPRVRNLGSARRLYLDELAEERRANPFMKDWLRRLERLRREVSGAAVAETETAAGGLPPPGGEEPWPTLRGVLAELSADAACSASPAQERLDVLAEFLRLEVDARQERISRLAGSIDPFRIVAVQRLLPILSEADAEIRDLRQFISSLRDGNVAAVYRQELSRACETMDTQEYARFTSALRDMGKEEPISSLHLAVADAPVSLHRLGWGIQACWELESMLRAAGRSVPGWDLVSAAAAVLNGATTDGLLLDLGAGTAEPLAWPESDAAALSWPWDLPLPPGDERACPETEAPPAQLAAELSDPSEAETEAEEAEADGADKGHSEIKHLVMSNLQSVSILLGFLRNPKITGIPGLVGEVANRTRNPQVIEVISTDRALHTGFANRDVPLACLRSPCNVSVKILRKFIHVKYISKVDMRRMALDKAGMRREVIREIEKYLVAL